jgi:ketosteroid isomerase-like protein
MRWFGGKHNGYGFTYLLMVVALAGCSKPLPDETRLRQAVAEMEKAAEAKQSGPILDYLTEDFLGNKVYHKVNMRALLLLHFRQNQHIQVYLSIAELSIKGDRAKLTCQAILAGRDEKPVPKRGQVLVIESDWEKRDDEWRVVRAHWQDPFLQP